MPPLGATAHVRLGSIDLGEVGRLFELGEGLLLPFDGPLADDLCLPRTPCESIERATCRL